MQSAATKSFSHNRAIVTKGDFHVSLLKRVQRDDVQYQRECLSEMLPICKFGDFVDVVAFSLLKIPYS